MAIEARFGSFPWWERVCPRPRRSKIGKCRNHAAIDDQARVPGLVRIADLLVVLGVGIGAARVIGAPIRASDGLEIVLVAILFADYFGLAGGYQLKRLRKLTAQIAGVSLAWLGTIGSVLASQFTMARLFAIGAVHLELWALIWFTGAWLTMLAVRNVVYLWMQHERRLGRWRVKVAIAGNGTAAFDLSRRLRSRDDDIDIVGVFVGQSCALQTARTIDDLYDLADCDRIDEVLVTLPWAPTTELAAVMRRLCALPVDTKIYAGTPASSLAHCSIDPIVGVPTLLVQRRPLVGWAGTFKRVEDIVVVGLVLCTLAPFFLLIALLIKVDSRGPVFFWQERYGFNNNHIKICKFRTMRHSLEPNPMVPQARRNDPRVTRVGGFLRRSSLDELPQLFNVLAGSMSLVGPRPHATIHNKKFSRLIDGYLGRHRMKPGITGWAQVNGHRGETDTIEKMRMRLEHDLYYIDNWSPLLDLKILAMTLPAVLSGQNAY